VKESLIQNDEVRGLQDILDECLGQLHQGQSLEACVAQYPTLAAQLEPLLRVALQVRALGPAPAPSPLAQRNARQRLLAEVALRKEKAQEQPRPFWLNLPSLLRRGAVAIVLAGVLLAAALGQGTLAASANSLPGDALYSVKRFGEQVRVLFAFDQQVKEKLREEMAERRREEAKAIATSQRLVEMAFPGAVEQVDGSSWTIGGVVVQTTPETEINGEVTVGALVSVHVRSLSDGTLQALRITAQPAETGPAPTALPTVAEPTVRPTATPTETQVPPTQAPFVPSPPTSTPTPTSTAKPTATPKPTRTPTPAREVKVRFRGRIDAIAANTWTVDGQVIRLDTKTYVDERSERASIGATATVLALRLQDDTLLALEIVIERAPAVPDQPFEFQGLIDSFGPTQWVVGGYTLIITADTAIENEPQRGLLAEVKSKRKGDGSLVAERIVVRLPTEEVQVEGLIQEVAAKVWVVEGVTVRLDAQTAVEGTPAVGLWAEVQGLELPDGSVLGRRIRVQSPPAVPLTQLPEATASPTTVSVSR